MTAGTGAAVEGDGMAGLDWMYGKDLPLLSLTFARGLTAAELLERMGADGSVALRTQEEFDEEFGDLVFESDAYVVSAGRYAEWAWAWEHGSWQCVQDEGLLREVSAGTEALVLHANELPMVDFRYAVDGELITGFNTAAHGPEYRSGVDPHRFDARLRALGADPDTRADGPLGPRGVFYRLAESLGAGLPYADLTIHPVTSAELLPRPARDLKS